MKIRTQILLFVLGVVLVSFLAVMWLSYSSSRKMVESESYKKAQLLVERHVQELDKFFKSSAKIAEGLAHAITVNPNIDESGTHALLQQTLKNNPQIYGMTLFFEPRPEEIGKKLFAPYYYYQNGILRYVPAEPRFKFYDQVWYTQPKKLATSVWTEPYYDKGAKAIMATYSVPIYQNSQFIGLATVDINLTELSQNLNSIKIGKNGYAILVSHEGTFLTHPQPDQYILKKQLLSVSKEIGNTQFQKIAQNMLLGQKGASLVVDPFTQKQSWVTYDVIPSTQYAIAAFLPHEELLTSVYQLRKNIIYMSVGAILLIIIAISIVSWRITDPILSLSRSAQKIADGNLNATIGGTTSNSEVGHLTQNIKTMVSTIQQTLSQVQEEKEKFEKVFATMSDGIVITDPTWMVISFNRSAQKMLEMRENINLIKHLSENFKTNFKLDDFFDYGKIQKTFELVHPETTQVKEIIFSGVMNTILDNHNKISAYVVTIRDVTEEKREELNKNSLLSLISHKLLTPITVLQNIEGMFQDKILGDLNQKQKENMKRIVANTSKLHTLVGRLLNYVTLTGEKEVAHDEVVIGQLLKSFQERAPEYADKKDVMINIEGTAEFGGIKFSQHHFDLILTELLENAVKFNKNEKVQIDIVLNKDSQNWTLKFKDNGIGIPSIHHDKIFEKFFQVDKYFTGNQEGVGLGLSLLKTIVDNYHGTISVESHEGQGSTFVISFPFLSPSP